MLEPEEELGCIGCTRYTGLCSLQVTGIWYRKVIVNDRNITERKSHVEEFPFVVRALEEGNMEVRVFFM